MRTNKRRAPSAPPKPTPVGGYLVDVVGCAVLAVAAYKIMWLLFALPDAPLF